jgi:hypothetical protein
MMGWIHSLLRRFMYDAIKTMILVSQDDNVTRIGMPATGLAVNAFS